MVAVLATRTAAAVATGEAPSDPTGPYPHIMSPVEYSSPKEERRLPAPLLTRRAVGLRHGG